MRSISVGLTHVAAGKACVMELVTKIALKTRRLRATEIAAKQQQIDESTVTQNILAKLYMQAVAMKQYTR